MFKISSYLNNYGDLMPYGKPGLLEKTWDTAKYPLGAYGIYKAWEHYNKALGLERYEKPLIEFLGWLKDKKPDVYKSLFGETPLPKTINRTFLDRLFSNGDVFEHVLEYSKQKGKSGFLHSYIEYGHARFLIRFEVAASRSLVNLTRALEAELGAETAKKVMADLVEAAKTGVIQVGTPLPSGKVRVTSNFEEVLEEILKRHDVSGKFKDIITKTGTASFGMMKEVWQLNHLLIERGEPNLFVITRGIRHPFTQSLRLRPNFVQRAWTTFKTDIRKIPYAKLFERIKSKMPEIDWEKWRDRLPTWERAKKWGKVTGVVALVGLAVYASYLGIGWLSAKKEAAELERAVKTERAITEVEQEPEQVPERKGSPLPIPKRAEPELTPIQKAVQAVFGEYKATAEWLSSRLKEGVTEDKLKALLQDLKDYFDDPSQINDTNLRAFLIYLYNTSQGKGAPALKFNTWADESELSGFAGRTKDLWK
ncbi:MAG: hypothetical protein PHU63_01030 [Candidatus ainarchaeum sp.]|nr:hypothetical protein [Candidatus ainarchaeum sp.]